MKKDLQCKKKTYKKKIQYNKALGFAADASYIEKSNPITENWSVWFNLRNEKFPNSSVVKKIRGKLTGYCDWNKSKNNLYKKRIVKLSDNN
jgi:hypothetical protein